MLRYGRIHQNFMGPGSGRSREPACDMIAGASRYLACNRTRLLAVRDLVYRLFQTLGQAGKLMDVDWFTNDIIGEIVNVLDHHVRIGRRDNDLHADMRRI